MKNNLIPKNHIHIRIFLYLVISFIYISFMSVYAPLGTNWLEWHFQRIYNFSEFLNINGYFSNYGFSIWNKCSDCELNSENWNDKIYLSMNFFTIFPYVLINDLFGSENLRSYGNFLDKIIIILTGCLISEIYLKFFRIKNNIYNLSIAILIFTFFIINPWTYKMFINGWSLIYFLISFLFGILMLLKNKIKLGLFFIFLAGFFDYQSSAGLFLFYTLLKISMQFANKNLNTSDYFPITFFNSINKILISLILPVIIFLTLRILISNEIDNSSGSSLLLRIGISGDDIHNGGILGALQFLGGNRITSCLVDFNGNLNSMDLNTKIQIFNCSLSILSMALISLLSILGLFLVYNDNKKFFNIIILPIIFLSLSYIFILQQSSSVHLMGYSYFFSILFSIGITSLLFKIVKKYNYTFLTMIILLPIICGLFILCLRVSMLTGLNG